MIPEFSRPCKADNCQTRIRIRQTVRFLKGKLFVPVLDIGGKTDLTVAIKKEYLNIYVSNTYGDFDSEEQLRPDLTLKFSTIIVSHILEHLLNPMKAVQLLDF